MDDVDCKLDLLLALQKQNRRRSSTVKPPLAAGPPTTERRPSQSESCTDEDQDREGAAGSTAGRPLGRAVPVGVSAEPLSDTDRDNYNDGR